MRVGIALGSNLGDRVAHLRVAVASIRALSEPPVRVSKIYETTPVDCPPNSPMFLNAAMEIGFSGELPFLLERLQAIERENERPAQHGRNAPRTVDLDILYADDLVIEQPNFILPHPRMMDRLFVLSPLCDIAPDRIIPGWQESFLQRKKTLSSQIDDKIHIVDSIVL